ncbi:MAG: ParB/RepB/Spo0J family partition protein [Clostridia bacterium]|nr:ParB/RepB/Spo0J family partition protein [Clostridia bacterium]
MRNGLNHAMGGQVCWLPLERITPRPSVGLEPTDGTTLMELVDSIRLHGLVQPITVQMTRSGRYVIVSGNRRFMACRMAGLSHIDAVVLEGVAADLEAQPLLESILSGCLHYLEEADAMKRLVERHGFTREELARSLGCTAAGVAQRIRLAELDEELQAFLLEQGLPERYAHALVKLPNRRARMTIARQAVREKLCVRDVELLVASAQSRLPVPPLPGGRTITLVRDHRLYLNAIRSIVAQMQEAGIEATTAERTLDGSVEVVLRLPTRRRRARKDS